MALSPPVGCAVPYSIVCIFSFSLLLVALLVCRMYLSRALGVGLLDDGRRFCSALEVSPSSFRYYSASVDYLTGTLINVSACLSARALWMEACPDNWGISWVLHDLQPFPSSLCSLVVFLSSTSVNTKMFSFAFVKLISS